MNHLQKTAFTCSSIFKPLNMDKLKELLKSVETGTNYKFELIESGGGFCRFTCVGSINGVWSNGKCKYSDYAFMSPLMDLIEIRQGVVIETVYIFADIHGDNVTVHSMESVVDLVTHNTWERFDSRRKALKRLREMCADSPSYIEPKFV